MKKGVIGGLIVAGLAGLAGWVAVKFGSSKTQQRPDEVADGGGGGYYYDEGSAVNAGGVPDLSGLITATQQQQHPRNDFDVIMSVLGSRANPSDEAADNYQADVLAGALAPEKLNAAHMVYNSLLQRADDYRNDDGTYTAFGYTYMDLNQLSGEMARQAAIQSIGRDAYNALGTGKQSALISSIAHGRADTIDTTGYRMAGGGANISNATFDTMLNRTVSGSRGGGGSYSSSYIYGQGGLRNTGSAAQNALNLSRALDAATTSRSLWSSSLYSKSADEARANINNATANGNTTAGANNAKKLSDALDRGYW